MKKFTLLKRCQGKSGNKRENEIKNESKEIGAKARVDAGIKAEKIKLKAKIKSRNKK